MLAPVHPAVTSADFEEMPPGPPYYQLIEGQLVMSPSPFTRHQRVVLRLGSLLHQFVQDRQLGEVFVAPLDVFLNELNVYQPDIAYLSPAQLHLVSEKGIEGAPDLCVEVLSKSTERFDRTTKKKVFAQCGLREYWLVDAEARTVTIFDLHANSEELESVLRIGEHLKSKLLRGLKIDLGRVFEGL